MEHVGKVGNLSPLMVATGQHSDLPLLVQSQLSVLWMRLWHLLCQQSFMNVLQQLLICASIMLVVWRQLGV